MVRKFLKWILYHSLFIYFLKNKHVCPIFPFNYYSQSHFKHLNQKNYKKEQRRSQIRPHKVKSCYHSGTVGTCLAANRCGPKATASLTSIYSNTLITNFSNLFTLITILQYFITIPCIERIIISSTLHGSNVLLHTCFFFFQCKFNLTYPKSKM